MTMKVAMGLMMLLAANLASAQAPAVPAAGEVIEVRIINVDAVVTDRKGNYVTNLTKDDFEIYENGVKQPVTNFYRASDVTVSPTTQGPAPASAVPAAETRPKKVVLFLDQLSVTPHNRNKLMESFKAFLQSGIHPGDEVMVVSWNHSLEIVQPFTADMSLTAAALDRLAGDTSAAIMYEQRRRDVEQSLIDLVYDYSIKINPKTQEPEAPPYESGINEVRQYAEQVAFDVRQTAGALKGLMATLAPIPEKKILVLATQALPAHPGREVAEYFDTFSSQFTGSTGHSALTDAASYGLTNEIQTIAEAANAAGFTIYPIHAAGAGADMPQAIDDHGMRGPAGANAKRTQVMEDAESLQLIASETGGVPVMNTSNFAVAFDTIERDLGSLYSLGYKATGGKADRQRVVEVKVKNPKYSVRTRRSFVEKSVESEVKEIVAANLFYPNRHNDMKIAASAGAAAPAEGGKVLLPVTVRIPMSSLTLLPDGTDLAGSFSVHVAFLKKDGAVSDVVSQAHAVRFPAESLKNRKEITLKLSLSMDPQTQRISVGVLDGTSHQTGFDTYVMAEEAAPAPSS